jgi:hypothetical protein
VFARAGAWWHTDDDRLGAFGLGLLAAVFVAEGLSGFLSRSGGPGAEREVAGHTAILTLGLAAPLLAGRSNRQRLFGYAALVPLALLGVGGVLLTGYGGAGH